MALSDAEQDEALTILRRLDADRSDVDKAQFAIGNINNAVAAIRESQFGIAAKLGTLTAGGQVDVPAMAQAIADDLGPELGTELVDALKAAL